MESNGYAGKRERDRVFRNSSYSWWDDVSNNYTDPRYNSLENSGQSSNQRRNRESYSGQYRHESNLYHPYRRRHQDIPNRRNHESSSEQYGIEVTGDPYGRLVDQYPPNPESSERSSNNHFSRVFHPTSTKRAPSSSPTRTLYPTQRSSRTAIRTSPKTKRNTAPSRVGDIRSNRASSITPPKSEDNDIRSRYFKRQRNN